MQNSETVFLWLFIASVFIIFYTYILFPLILSILSRGRKISRYFDTNGKEGVSILMAVFNEEAVIAAKLDSIVTSDFSLERLEVLIGSDASTDRSDEIIRSYAAKYPFIKLIQFEERTGKPSVINRLVRDAKYSLLVMTDANVIFEAGMLKKLSSHFNHPDTGLVGANIINVGITKQGISIQEKSYIERENLIKYREGLLWGCMMGPFGGCYMMRKDLFEPVPKGFLVDDFFICMKVILKKFKCINDLEAICFEDVSDDLYQEFRRKSRISSGNYQNLKVFRSLLLRPFSPEGFCFISHKFLRWMTPFLILISLVSLSILSMYQNIYLLLFIGEIILILSPLFDFIARKAGIHFKVLRFIAYFSFMNLALLKGFIKYVRGIRSGIWTPTKRN